MVPEKTDEMQMDSNKVRLMGISWVSGAALDPWVSVMLRFQDKIYDIQINANFSQKTKKLA